MRSAELARKIRRVHIRSSRAVDAMMAGRFRSVFRGSGLEFEEVREYTPGDDVKSIDWKVSARMNKPFVKLYREERELTIMLLVDVSRSQLFGVGDGLKRDAAAELAAVLAVNAMRNNDKVGLILFSDHVERYVPPKKGSAHSWRVIHAILGHEPAGAGTNIAAAVDHMAKVCRKKAVAFCISDFLDRDYLKSMRVAARRHDLIAALLYEPAELSLPRAGMLDLMDLETGRRMTVDCSSNAMRREYEQRRRKRLEDIEEGFRLSGVDAIRMPVDASPADSLNRFFRARERRPR